MAFKMKGWAPKGPLTYRGGGEATNMPTTNPPFLSDEDNIKFSHRSDNRSRHLDSSNFYSNIDKSSQLGTYKKGEPGYDDSGDNVKSMEQLYGFENLNDDINKRDMPWVDESMTAVNLTHDDISNLKVAVQRGNLDKATKEAYASIINRGAGSTAIIDPKSGINYQSNTGGVITNPTSTNAMNSLLTTLNQGREGGNYPDIDEEEIREGDRKKLMRDVSREARKFEIGGADRTNRLKNIPEEKEEEEAISTFKPRKKNNTSTGPSSAFQPSDRNIEGNKGGKTLSQRRAASVGKDKLDTYSKAWNENRGNVRAKYKTQAQFEKAAKEWWAKKGLDK